MSPKGKVNIERIVWMAGVAGSLLFGSNVKGFVPFAEARTRSIAAESCRTVLNTEAMPMIYSQAERLARIEATLEAMSKNLDMLATQKTGGGYGRGQ